MAKYRVTSPEGQTFEITAPDDATDEQVQAYAEQNMKPEPSALQRLGKSFVQGSKMGFPGMVLSGVYEGSKLVNEQMDKISYGAGGMATDYASGLGASPEVAAGAGVLAKSTIEAVPAYLTGKVAGTLASPLMQKMGKGLMQSAVKPERGVRLSGEADRAIKTMLDKGINATAGGMEATQSKVSAMEAILDKTLKMSPATVDKATVGAHVRTALYKVRLDLERAGSEAEIMKAYDDFMSHEALSGLGNNIPVYLANKMKQAFYKELTGKAYIPGAPLSAYDKGQKAIASGLRTEVGAAEPSVVPTLEEQGELLNVLKVLKPRVSVEGNKNIIGLGVLAPSMERVAVWMLDRYPWFKSVLARASYSGSQRIPEAVAGSGAAVYETQRNKSD